MLSVLRRKLNTLFYTERILTKKIERSFIYPLLPDRWALDLLFYNRFGRRINWKAPKTYNEKLQWLKLYNRNPLYTKLVDKYAVKDWVAEMIGPQYVIPTYGVWDSYNEIDFTKLPDRFVLKTTHSGGSSGVVICRDKDKFDYEDAKNRLSASLKSNSYMIGREWPYKDVPHRIIAEKYMAPLAPEKDLPDYKFFCFWGEVKALFVGTERQNPNEEVKFDFFDEEFNHLPFCQGHDNAKTPPRKPENFEAMKIIAERLSEGIPHVRVDLYDVDGEIYFGEMTFFHFSGNMPFEPDEWDARFGDYLQLNSINRKSI